MKNRFRNTFVISTSLMLALGVLPVSAMETEEETGKEETVYIIADASGQKQKVIVSDRLKTQKNEEVRDVSGLENIANVSGSETFRKDAQGNLIWNAEGKDIYYQGTTDEQVPVQVNISYQLNGKPVSADELAGKDGHVVIRMDYVNSAQKTITVNGTSRLASVPFVMVSGMKLDAEHFSNVKVTNGKLISEGKDLFAAGVVFPGLKDSLSEDENLRDKLKDSDIPDFIEIEADVTDFTLGMTLTLADSDLLSGLDLDFDTDELTGKIDELQNGAVQLLDGAAAFKDGTAQLRSGAGELEEGT